MVRRWTLTELQQAIHDRRRLAFGRLLRAYAIPDDDDYAAEAFKWNRVHTRLCYATRYERLTEAVAHLNAAAEKENQ
jgi:hypothetical protein